MKNTIKPIPETRPKVSVIIPIYNVEKYIVECIASVVNQTIEDIEIICVDDGSPDNSIDLIEKEFGDDKRIKIVRKKNGGLSSARNAGAGVATGEYLYFLDSDDYIEIDAMEICYKEAKENDLDLLDFNGACFIDEHNSDDEYIALKERADRAKNYYDRKGDYSEVITGQMLFARMRENKEVCAVAWLHFIRHDFYSENNLNFYDGIVHEDNLFTLKCTFLAKRAKHIPNKLYHHRLRIGSIMTTKEGVKNLKGYFITYCEALRFLMSEGDKFDLAPKNALISQLNSYLWHIRRLSKLVSDEELNQFISELSDFDKIIFDYVIKLETCNNKIRELETCNRKSQEELETCSHKIRELETCNRKSQEELETCSHKIRELETCNRKSQEELEIYSHKIQELENKSREYENKFLELYNFVMDADYESITCAEVNLVLSEVINLKRNYLKKEDKLRREGWFINKKFFRLYTLPVRLFGRLLRKIKHRRAGK